MLGFYRIYRKVYDVIFGKASSCDTPLMVRLNDREIFLDQFRPDVISENIVDEMDEAEVNQDNEEEIPS